MLFKGEARFIAAAKTISSMPPSTLPEIVFLGKSNVGKSSLLNAILYRKSLARVSSLPGCTSQINFFELAGKYILVDVPGYGYAKVSKKEKQNWEKIMLYYLSSERDLRLACVLIDSRRGVKENDKILLRLLRDYGLRILVVFTKCDKIKQSSNDAEDNVDFVKSLGQGFSYVAVSVKDHDSIEELRSIIIKTLNI